jgi:hypothetical protein
MYHHGRLPSSYQALHPNTTLPPADPMQPIKTKKVRLSRSPILPHPLSLDTLPSPTNKWSAMTHPLCATIMGFCGMVVLYAHFYFHCGQVLLVHAYAMSTTATTVGDGGDPRGSTELDNKSGNNFRMNNAKFHIFACLSWALILPATVWAREMKDTNNATTPLSTCSLLTLSQSPTFTW